MHGRSPLFKGLVGLVAPVATVISTLLALGIISPAHSQDAVAKGIETTRDASSSELTLQVDVARPPGGAEEIAFSAEGVFDYQSRRGRLQYDFSRTAGLGSATAVQAVFVDDVLYMRLPPLPGVSPRRPWIKVDLTHLDKLLANIRAVSGDDGKDLDLGFLEGLDFTDPSRALEYLERSTGLRKVGEQLLVGTQTTVYRGKLAAPREAGRGKTSYVVKAWIDGDHLIRQLTVEGGPERLRLTLGLRRFGIPVKVEAPPAARVASQSSLVRALLP
jgi:hypothetical protein